MDVAFKPGVTETAYASRAEMMQDLIGIVRREIQAAVDAGVPYVQVDAPRYNRLLDHKRREHMEPPQRLYQPHRRQQKFLP